MVTAKSVCALQNAGAIRFNPASPCAHSFSEQNTGRCQNRYLPAGRLSRFVGLYLNGSTSGITFTSVVNLKGAGDSLDTQVNSTTNAVQPFSGLSTLAK